MRGTKRTAGLTNSGIEGMGGADKDAEQVMLYKSQIDTCHFQKPSKNHMHILLWIPITTGQKKQRKLDGFEAQIFFFGALYHRIGRR